MAKVAVNPVFERFERNSWIGFLVRTFPRSFAANTIYHYTQIGSLFRLVDDDDDIWCTEPSMLNDSAELYDGIDCMLRVLRDKKGYEKDKIANIEWSLKKAMDERFFIPWVASFSAASDSLSQWMGYVDRTGGGYAIGFNMEKFVCAVERSNDALRRNVEPHQIIFLPCVYSQHDKEQLAGIFEQIHPEVFLPFKNGVHGLDEKTVNLVRSVFFFATLTKNESFAQEKEWRMAVWPQSNKEFDEAKLLGGKLRIPSHIKEYMGHVRDCISEIVVSPHGNKAALQSAARILKMKHRLNFSVANSVSTYNGF